MTHFAVRPAVAVAGRETSYRELGHIESFYDKLRDECSNRELFGSLAEARAIVESWRV